MRLVKKLLKILGGLILLLLIGIGIHIYFSGPALPEETDAIIEKVLKNPLPEIIKGETGFAISQGLRIWYEKQSPKDSVKGTVLLIMGHSNDALSWPQNFISAFVDAGYEVIRYDHRGTGLSDRVENWDRNNPYSLQDMALDGISILDTLNIQKAHIIGVSMGGMIAQEIVINHPERSTSLASIMSSSNIFDTTIAPISSEIPVEMIKAVLKYGLIGGEKNKLKLQVAHRKILMGKAKHEIDIQELTERSLYTIRKRNGYNFRVGEQHQKAITASSSRYEKLNNVKIPVLVVHGELDPLIPIAHGRKSAAAIPDADSLWLPNMGHGIHNDIMDVITQRTIANFDRNLE